MAVPGTTGNSHFVNLWERTYRLRGGNGGTPDTRGCSHLGTTGALTTHRASSGITLLALIGTGRTGRATGKKSAPGLRPQDPGAPPGPPGITRWRHRDRRHLPGPPGSRHWHHRDRPHRPGHRGSPSLAPPGPGGAHAGARCHRGSSTAEESGPCTGDRGKPRWPPPQHRRTQMSVIFAGSPPWVGTITTAVAAPNILKTETVDDPAGEAFGVLRRQQPHDLEVIGAPTARRHDGAPLFLPRWPRPSCAHWSRCRPSAGWWPTSAVIFDSMKWLDDGDPDRTLVVLGAQRLTQRCRCRPCSRVGGLAPGHPLVLPSTDERQYAGARADFLNISNAVSICTMPEIRLVLTVALLAHGLPSPRGQPLPIPALHDHPVDTPEPIGQFTEDARDGLEIVDVERGDGDLGVGVFVQDLGAQLLESLHLDGRTELAVTALGGEGAAIPAPRPELAPVMEESSGGMRRRITEPAAETRGLMSTAKSWRRPWRSNMLHSAKPVVNPDRWTSSTPASP